MSAKVTLTKTFGMKTRYIQNGLPFLTLELSRKTKQWHKKYDKYQFCTQRSPKNSIITKNFGKVKRRYSVKNLYLSISQYSQENTCVGVSF